MDLRSKIILIYGPTASGKSKFAIKLAKKTKGEIPYQFMDYSKLNKFFGWKPKYKFVDTIDEVFEWYKNYLKSYKNS